MRDETDSKNRTSAAAAAGTMHRLHLGPVGSVKAVLLENHLYKGREGAAVVKKISRGIKRFLQSVLSILKRKEMAEGSLISRSDGEPMASSSFNVNRSLSYRKCKSQMKTGGVGSTRGGDRL